MTFVYMFVGAFTGYGLYDAAKLARRKLRRTRKLRAEYLRAAKSGKITILP